MSFRWLLVLIVSAESVTTGEWGLSRAKENVLETRAEERVTEMEEQGGSDKSSTTDVLQFARREGSSATLSDIPAALSMHCSGKDPTIVKMLVSSIGLTQPWPTLYDAWADRSRAQATFLLASHLKTPEGASVDGKTIPLKDLKFCCMFSDQTTTSGKVVSIDYSELPTPDTEIDADTHVVQCPIPSKLRQASGLVIRLYRIDSTQTKFLYPSIQLCYPRRRSRASKYKLTAMTQFNRDWKGDCGSLLMWASYYLMMGAEKLYIYDMSWTATPDSPFNTSTPHSSGPLQSDGIGTSRSAVQCIGSLIDTGHVVVINLFFDPGEECANYNMGNCFCQGEINHIYIYIYIYIVHR
jgi:hypothetical protein